MTFSSRPSRKWNRASTTDRMIRRTCGGSERTHSVEGEKSMTRWTLRGLTAMTLVATAFAGAFGQAGTGTVAGQVTVLDTKAPLTGAQVSVAGTTLGAVANAEGRYVI